MNLSDGVVERDNEDPAALESFVASVQHLPLFTGTAAQLIRSVDREDVTAGELAKLISTDPALVAHLLRLVNSPYYGVSRQIGTVTEAFALLGLNLVRRTVTVAVLQRPLFAYLHDTSIARAFWRHELLCAALARHMALRAGVNGELAYMAGLLHDVGRLVMLMQFPALTNALLDRPGVGDGYSSDFERAEVGFTHSQVGAALLELWGLPESIVQSAHQHLDETEPEEAIAAAVWRANLLCHEFDESEDADEEQPWMQAIGLTVAARHLMIEEIEALGSDGG